MEEKNIVPLIRFKGFSGKWEERKLDDISEEKNGGGTPKTFVESYWNGSIPWIQSSDLTEDELSNVYPRKFISEAGLKHSATKLVPQNSIAIITRVGVGKLAYMPFSYTTSQDYLSLSKLNIDAWFSVYAIYKKINGELNAVQGTSIKGITKDELLSKCILIPNNPKEQSKIGIYFQNLDRLITLQQQKHNKLVTLKKAMLDKMFPKEGEVVPEIRFKGFTEDWVVSDLKTLADRYDNLRNPITASERLPGITPYYGANGIQDYVEGYTHNGEFILIAEDGANDLKNYPVQYVIGKIWVNNHAHVLQAKKNIADNKFLKYSISQTNIEPYLVGGGRAKLNAETMMKIEICVSKQIQEQEKIGFYFIELDKLIDLQQRELEKLKQLKRAFLKKMFV